MKKLAHGEWFRIDKEENGEWKKAKTINDEYVLNAVGWIIYKNGKFEREIDWSKLYGTLDEGSYRIVKRISGYGNQKEIYAEFTIK